MTIRKHTLEIKLIPAVEALTRTDRSRLYDLLDIASVSRTRWHIRDSDETLRQVLDFPNVSRWLEFSARLIESELLYCCDDGTLLPSPRLCPDEEDFPCPPTFDESLVNFGGIIEARWKPTTEANAND